MSKDNKDFFKRKNEWSEIKDKLLGCYLPQYFQKLLTSEKPIYYVDCFAGKGKFDDGKLGSPLIAMEIREDCLKRSNAKQAQRMGALQTCFIELKHADELRKNISNSHYLYDSPEVVEGKFEEKIREKLKDKQDYNVFLYIDPYGIKELDCNLFDEFESFGFRTFEMLINFNSFGFFRDACSVMKVDYSKDEALSNIDDLVELEPTEVGSNSKSERLLNSIAGGDYWKQIVIDYQNGLYDGFQAEKELSKAYKQRLNQKYTYVLDMPIRLRANQRPKYRMIHVSDHEDACYLMAQNMQSRKDELFIDIQRNGMFNIFDFMPDVSSSVEGETITEKEIIEMVEEYLKCCQKETRIRVFLAGFCNEYGIVCGFDMIYKLLDDLETKGKIQILRNPEFTKTGRKSTFWDEKKHKTVTIRRIKS